ncbi:MAG: undecaprenyldiphospho-muramoylpentapeptide beta-N-acetylglucosaminyltransferase [Nitrospirota bacterium]|nr:undecaprenyldiphospho-muramoylpentapeptide beta-N-acetylglucosaminyltransferase [Nitrospirota bacterium]
MNVLIAGGGTGGHLFPGLAVAAAFRDSVPQAQVAFAGTAHGLEARVVPKHGYHLYVLPVMGMIRVGLVRRLLALAVLPSAFAAAWRIVSEFRPDLVVGVGGYASAPILFVAGLRRIPRVIMEQNAIPGVTNRVFGPSVDRVFLAFDAARTHFRGGRFSVAGNPVRAELLRAPLKAATDAPHLLVFGGSQGAQAINGALVDALDALFEALPGLTVTLQTGERDQGRMESAVRRYGERVRVLAFIDDMGAAYARADVVIARAGATSLAEITALGKPSILIPYPHATHDHQRANALALADANAAILLEQKDLTPERLAATVTPLLRDAAARATMAKAALALGRPDAAARIVGECLEIARAAGHAAPDSSPTSSPTPSGGSSGGSSGDISG